MTESLNRWALRNCDPRYYQIAALLVLLLYGLLRLRFDVHFSQALTILTTVLIVQYICGRAWKLRGFDPRSALISGLSLCLLLRTNSLLLAAAVAAPPVWWKHPERCQSTKFLAEIHPPCVNFTHDV